MKYTVISLSGAYRETGSRLPKLPSSGEHREFRLDRFIEQVDRLLKRRKLPVLVVYRRADFHLPPFGAMEELYYQLGRLAQRGGELWYYADSYRMIDCYLSSQCSCRCINYLGTVTFRGAAKSGLFFTKAFASQGIGVKVIRQGEYKSAGAPFTEEQFDQYDREQWETLLRCSVDHIAQRTAAGKGFSQELIDELLSGVQLTAEQAVQREVIERITTFGELCSYWKGEKLGKRPLPKPRGTWGWNWRGRSVALLFLEGAVMDGKDRNSPLLGQVLGDEPLVKTISELAGRSRIKAVVLRINSGGGSAIAHENILKALEMLARKKPLVISMGPVAASGGYWIAHAGRSVLAGETTVTGSIGVVGLFFTIHRFLQSRGITVDMIKKGDFSDEGSVLRDMNEAEVSDIETSIRQVYRTFVRRTAAARSMSENQVEEVARGRVWCGRDALDQGLIDEIGTLSRALELAMSEAGGGSYKVKVYPKRKPSLIQKLLFSSSSQVFRDIRLLAGEAAAVSGKPLLLDIHSLEYTQSHLPLDI